MKRGQESGTLSVHPGRIPTLERGNEKTSPP